MIVWIALFLLVVGISFILAWRSMRDYLEIPQKSKLEYGIFLVRQNFDANTLDAFRETVFAEKLIFSIERLFKGNQSALTIFGPKAILEQFSDKLNLLELEDYMVSIDSNDIVIWELGTRSSRNLHTENVDPASGGAGNIFQDLPKLESDDQFFWQVILGEDQTQIRAALFTKDPARRKTLVSLLQNLKPGGLTKIPRPYSNQQMLTFYKQRILSKDSLGPILSSEEVGRLLQL